MFHIYAVFYANVLHNAGHDGALKQTLTSKRRMLPRRFSVYGGKMSERVQSTAQFVAPVHSSESEKSSFPFKVDLRVQYAAHLIIHVRTHSTAHQAS